jgi:hypothetical protein
MALSKKGSVFFTNVTTHPVVTQSIISKEPKETTTETALTKAETQEPGMRLEEKQAPKQNCQKR